jgi:hypothetical protein
LRWAGACPAQRRSSKAARAEATAASTSARRSAPPRPAGGRRWRQIVVLLAGAGPHPLAADEGAPVDGQFLRRAMPLFACHTNLPGNQCSIILEFSGHTYFPDIISLFPAD